MRYLILLLLPLSVSAQEVVICDNWGACRVYEDRSFSNLQNPGEMLKNFGNSESVLQRVERNRTQRLQNEQLMIQNELLRQQLEQQR